MGRPSFYDSDLEDKWGVIYILLDPRNGRAFYVGVTTQRLCNRFAGHMTDARKGYDDPKSARIREIIGIGAKPHIREVERVDKSTWADRERYWIAMLREQGCELDNLCPGGYGVGVARSAETRKKMSDSARGRDMSAVHKPAVRELVALKLGHPVIIAGIRYRSIRFAAKQLGMDDATLRYQLGFGKPLKGRPTGNRHHNSRPVEVEGVIYATGRAAAKAIGISPASLIGRIKRGKARYVTEDLGVFG